VTIAPAPKGQLKAAQGFARRPFAFLGHPNSDVCTLDVYRHGHCLYARWSWASGKAHRVVR